MVEECLIEGLERVGRLLGVKLGELSFEDFSVSCLEIEHVPLQLDMSVDTSISIRRWSINN